MIDKHCTHGIWILALLILAACSQEDKKEPYMQTHITGKITVDAELDTTRDYSGIELKILRPDTLGQLNDTLFYAVTDEDGSYAGNARIPKSDIYPLSILRRSNELGVVNLVLADKDTVQFDAELPDLEETAQVQSRENDLFTSYERLQAGINRIFQFANAGLVTGDTLEMEMMKWSDMFWDFYEDNLNTFAGQQAAASSIRLLEGWQDELMMERLWKVIDDDPSLIPFASRIGIRYYTDEYNLDQALTFIDSLVTKNASDRINMELKMNKIKLLYDSARVETVKHELDRFKTEYQSYREASSWVENFEYELATLAPGSKLPDFEIITLEGNTITRESMKGKPYMLEFTRFDNFLYQQQFDRNIAIYHIYKNYGLEFLTVPFEATEVVMNAFFDERARLWPFAQPGTFNADELREKFNLNILPTRILVDKNGMIVRKYEGTEFNDIVRGLQIVLTDIKEEEAL